MTTSFEPKRSLAECKAILGSPGMPHETELAVVDGRVLNVYKNVEPNLRTFWLKYSAVHPEWEYLVYEEDRYTYQQIADSAKDVANTLKDVYGIRKGDRVSIVMRNFPEYVISLWACALLGAVSTMVNPWLTDDQLRYCMDNTTCKVHLVDPERADRFEALNWGAHNEKFIVARPQEGKGSWKRMESWNAVFTGSRTNSDSWKQEPECEREDDCAILFTSGTTSMPKAVLSTQRSFIQNQVSARWVVMLDILRKGEMFGPPDPNAPQGVALFVTPLFHVAGATSLMMGATFGSRKLVFMRKWILDEAVKIVEKENIVQIAAVPSVITDVLQRSEELAKKIQMMSSGGAPLPSTIPGDLAEKFPNAFFFQAYGLTETNAIASLLGGIDQYNRPDSSGLAVPICDFLIVHPDSGKVMPTGQIGEIWIRGSNVFKCYFNDPVATKAALTLDGWFKSGDAGYLDPEGYLYVKDRYKDIIIRGGENIHSTTVENALHEHPEINDVAAIGVPDARLGELVAAIVAITPGSKLTEKSVIAFAKTKLQWLAVPVMVLVVNEPMERNATGKIVKTDLKPMVNGEWAKRQGKSAKL